MEILWQSLRRLIPDDANLEFSVDAPNESQWGEQTPRQVLQQFFDEDR